MESWESQRSKQTGHLFSLYSLVKTIRFSTWIYPTESVGINWKSPCVNVRTRSLGTNWRRRRYNLYFHFYNLFNFYGVFLRYQLVLPGSWTLTKINNHYTYFHSNQYWLPTSIFNVIFFLASLSTKRKSRH